MRYKKIENKIFKRFLTFFILSSVLLFTLKNSQIYAQESYTDTLKYAQEKYDQGYFHQVIKMLGSSISEKKFKEPEDRDEAYKFLALAYLALDYPREAEQTVKKLLKQNKKYEPDTPMDPEFQRLVKKIKEEQELEKVKLTLKFWIIGGSAVAIVTYFLLKPEKKEQEELPMPPDHPSGR
jgi:hypothetical protein